MARLLFYAHPNDLGLLEDTPADNFVCMYGKDIHADARAQLYSLILGIFLDEARDLEEELDHLSMDSVTLSKLPQPLTIVLAELDEAGISRLLQDWSKCEDVLELPLDEDDLEDYLINLAHLCHHALEEEADVYTWSTL